MSSDELQEHLASSSCHAFPAPEDAPPVPADWNLLVTTDAEVQAELDALRILCSSLQFENQSLASMVYEKDKATRLLLANVEAWKQKLDWVEKRKVEEVQRLQACIAERERLIEHLAQGVGTMRLQLEEWRTAEAANAAAMCRLQELERENITLLSILQGKCKDNPSVLQHLASLQTVKQDLRLHETENARLVCMVGQRDKQVSFMTSRLDEARGRIEHFTWDCTADGGQLAATVRELVIERDRLKAQVAAVCVGRDHQMLVMQQQQQQQQQLQQQQLRHQSEPESAISSQQQAVINDYNKELVRDEEERISEYLPVISVAAAMVEEVHDIENTCWKVQKPEFDDEPNENSPCQLPGDRNPIVPPAPMSQTTKVKPIGSGRSNKAKTASTKSKTGATPVKEINFGRGGGESSAAESPGSALASAFNRLTVGAQRSPLGALTQ